MAPSKKKSPKKKLVKTYAPLTAVLDEDPSESSLTTLSTQHELPSHQHTHTSAPTVILIDPHRRNSNVSDGDPRPNTPKTLLHSRDLRAPPRSTHRSKDDDKDEDEDDDDDEGDEDDESEDEEQLDLLGRSERAARLAGDDDSEDASSASSSSHDVSMRDRSDSPSPGPPRGPPPAEVRGAHAEGSPIRDPLASPDEQDMLQSELYKALAIMSFETADLENDRDVVKRLIKRLLQSKDRDCMELFKRLNNAEVEKREAWSQLMLEREGHGGGGGLGGGRNEGGDGRDAGGDGAGSKNGKGKERAFDEKPTPQPNGRQSLPSQMNRSNSSEHVKWKPRPFRDTLTPHPNGRQSLSQLPPPRDRDRFRWPSSNSPSISPPMRTPYPTPAIRARLLTHSYALTPTTHSNPPTRTTRTTADEIITQARLLRTATILAPFTGPRPTDLYTTDLRLPNHQARAARHFADDAYYFAHERDLAPHIRGRCRYWAALASFMVGATQGQIPIGIGDGNEGDGEWSGGEEDFGGREWVGGLADEFITAEEEMGDAYNGNERWRAREWADVLSEWVEGMDTARPSLAGLEGLDEDESEDGNEDEVDDDDEYYGMGDGAGAHEDVVDPPRTNSYLQRAGNWFTGSLSQRERDMRDQPAPSEPPISPQRSRAAGLGGISASTPPQEASPSPVGAPDATTAPDAPTVPDLPYRPANSSSPFPLARSSPLPAASLPPIRTTNPTRRVSNTYRVTNPDPPSPSSSNGSPGTETAEGEQRYAPTELATPDLLARLGGMVEDERESPGAGGFRASDLGVSGRRDVGESGLEGRRTRIAFDHGVVGEIEKGRKESIYQRRKKKRG